MSPVPASTFWIPASRRLSTMHSAGSSSSGDSSSPRHYVDPWDLENYAYLRRHCADPADSDPVVSLSTNGLDSAHSDFYFIPARQPLAPVSTHHHRALRGARRPSLMVMAEDPTLVDEETVYNPRCQTRTCYHQKPRRHSMADCLHHVSFQPGLNEKPRARQLTSAKEPPPLVYVYQAPSNRKISRHYRDPVYTSSDETEGLYDDLASLARRRSKPKHFGLSTFGHLKIDYSCNWSNLDRYIAHI